MMEIAKLIELDELARAETDNYPKKRSLFNTISEKTGKHFIGITGSRGVGKTVLLKQLSAAQERSFYLSVDTLGDHDLFETLTLQDTDAKTGAIGRVAHRYDRL